MGYVKIDLAQYIDHGVCTETFRMDEKGELYLTVKISVVEPSQEMDIVMMSIMANNRRIAAQNRAEGIHPVDSDDECDVQGDTLKEAFSYYHKVFDEDDKLDTTK